MGVSDLDLILGAEALALDEDGFGMVQEAVQEGGGEDGQNLSMRMSMRRFTRLTNGFSKKIDNHMHAIALHF
ncbi:hypothetical protein B2A_09309, partial [mine drainage metagenome]